MIIELPEELTIAAVAEVRDRLLIAWGTRAPVQLDARGVRHLDVAGAQLLLAARRSSSAAGRPLTFVDGAPGAVIDGVLEELGMPSLQQEGVEVDDG